MSERKSGNTKSKYVNDQYIILGRCKVYFTVYLEF